MPLADIFCSRVSPGITSWRSTQARAYIQLTNEKKISSQSISLNVVRSDIHDALRAWLAQCLHDYHELIQIFLNENIYTVRERM